LDLGVGICLGFGASSLELNLEIAPVDFVSLVKTEEDVILSPSLAVILTPNERRDLPGFL